MRLSDLHKSAAAALVGFSLFALPAGSEPLKDVNIGLSTASLTVASLRVAKEMGLFEQQGLNPRFVAMDSGNAALSGLIGRSFDAVIATSPDLIAAQARGQKVVAIANIYGGLGATLVIAKSVADKLGVAPSAPVKDRLKALDGLTFALPSPTAGYTVAFQAAAKTVGINVRSIFAAAPAMSAAMESGSVQGFVTSAPYWTSPVVKGTAVVWLSGPKGEFPPESTPTSSASLQMLRDAAEANPDLVRRLVNVVDGMAKAVKERPADVRAAMAKVFPDIDAATIDIFLSYEGESWRAKALTAQDMVHEIAFVKASGLKLPELDTLNPAALVYP